MKLEAGKEMDRRCVINWLLEVYRHPNVAFHTHSDEQQREYAHDAIVLLNDDCRNCELECLLQKYCKRECLLQKYNELKEKYNALLKEQKAVVQKKLIRRKTENVRYAEQF